MATKYNKNIDKQEYKRQKEEQMKEVTKKLEDGVKNVLTSDENYKNYLKVMSKFHRYSANNSLMIAMQRPDATSVASFTTWKSLGRNINKGAKGIQIFMPRPYKGKEEFEVEDPITKEKKKVTQEVSRLSFKIANVFDVSDTNGRELPQICTEIQGTAKELKAIEEAVKEISGITVRYEDIKGGSKGYYDVQNHEIAVKKGMSELASAKTVVHELAHSMLDHKDTEYKADRHTKEVRAESIAYCVLNHFGLKSDEYSFNYIATWSSGKDIKELKDSLKIIQEKSMKIIDVIEEKVKELEINKENDITKSLKEKEVEITYSNYPNVHKGDVLTLKKADEIFTEINEESQGGFWNNTTNYKINFKIRDEHGNEKEVIEPFEPGAEVGGLKQFFKENFSKEISEELFGEDKNISSLDAILDKANEKATSTKESNNKNKEMVR